MDVVGHGQEWVAAACAGDPACGRWDWRSDMLVITRREGEEVVIGNPHRPLGIVRVGSIKGDRVRLAFDFSRDVDVHRREVAEQIVNQAPDVIGSVKPA